MLWGMPTEFMTQQSISDIYGEVREFRTPHKDHYHHHSLRRAQVTDDTEQTLALLDAYFKHGYLDAQVTAQALVSWAHEKDVFNSTYLGPSSRRALQRLMRGGDDPAQTGLFGTTVGGAMRMLPVAWASLGDQNRAVHTAVQVSMPTHGTSLAISGAAAMALALMECFSEGSDLAPILTAACEGAKLGLSYGYPYPGASIAKRIRWAVDLAVSAPDLKSASAALYDYIGGVDMVPHEIIPPVVMALFARPEEPMERLIGAVNIGGDTDTIASMLGALLGAFYGVDVFPPQAMWEEIEYTNGIDFHYYAVQMTRKLKTGGFSDER